MKQQLKSASLLAIAVLFVCSAIFVTPSKAVDCGDVNGEAGLDISDLVYLIDFMFNGGPGPIPDDCAADVDGILGMDIADLVYIIDYMFNGGPPLPPSCCGECISGDTQPCYTGPGGTENIGACTAGIQNCVDGEWSACTGETLPGTEVCNGLDDDCNGTADDNPVDGTNWYLDSDGDNYGDASITISACSQPPGYVADNTDCDDSDNSINPGWPEHCDGLDNDCSGTVDDNNPVGGSTYWPDLDGDGYGDANNPLMACSIPVGYVENDLDCNDLEISINPDSDELCNSIDDNCNGQVDDNPIDGIPWYFDADFDGYGDGQNFIESCTQPSGYIADGTDCDDNNPAINPGVSEVCNGVDDDCNAIIDDNISNCGTLPNATVACIAGACTMTGCDFGYADCDGNPNTGCELKLNVGFNCNSTDFLLAPMSADGCDIPFRTYGDRGDMDLRIRLEEDCTSPFTSDDFNVRFRLTSPAGTDYDLYIYEDNCTQIGSSTTGAVDEVIIQWNDALGSDDTKFVRIQIRYNGGSSCDDWDLDIDSWATQANPVRGDDSDNDSN